MATSHRDRVGRALELLGTALDGFITSAVSDEIPPGKDWTLLLTVRDQRKGASGKAYDRRDVQAGLRMLTENVTGQLKPEWHPIRDKLSRPEQAMASELRAARDEWAHLKPFTEDDAYRTLDTAERLLRAIGAPAAADEVRTSRQELRRLAADKQDRRVVAPTASVAATGLKPWREVLQPHRDVSSGQFTAAEFAADLHQVATGKAVGEYGDPAEFFGRTYVTEGLRELLTGAVRRVTGDGNASPVVNLQTTFGGGKTHSMLSLWHLFSGVVPSSLPQDVQDLLLRAGAPTPLPAVRRVAIVGNHLTPGAVDTKPDGTKVHTLWGELAWQLGGPAGYEYIAEADRTATNPGTRLFDLLAAHGPAVILIDEWVAYARQLVDVEGLPGGSFDTHFTFAQTLTEAAKATPGVLLVISIPASPDADRSDALAASAAANDEEVGGKNGLVALRRLQNVVRRVASQWRAASADEAFEIVRQRLFERPDAEALAHIGATARAMVDFYRRNGGDFPAEAVDNAYADRIRRCYPVHPEMFDRLYEDWSTLDRFQRTRGVLRLMNTLVHALWVNQDGSPLIMPGSVPLAVDPVVTELTQYVEDDFKSVISADVEGPQSTPRQVDEANRALLGARVVTQRLARTIFLGATPTLRTANKGLDRQRVFLGTALPGDVPGNFHSALGQLSERAAYLYTSGSSYWYDTQANTSRTARDHAAQLHVDEVIAEVDRRLEAQRRPDPRGFAAVHLTDDPAGVPDGEEVRLVVLPLRHPHDRKAGADSRAVLAARRVLDQRQGGQRIRRNLVVLLAADATRAGELEQAVRDHLGWKHVVDHADGSLDLTAQQKGQAVERLTRTDRLVADRLLDTYTWALAPEAGLGQPYTVRPVRAEGAATSVVDRAAKKLVADSELSLVQAAAVIRQQLDRLPSLWEHGHVSVEDLWGLYAQYPYLPRLRDRGVLEQGVLGALDNALAWQVSTFALAEDHDEQARRYVGLRLPGDDGPAPAVTGRTLLVRPDVALAQREAELAVERARTAEAGGTVTNSPPKHVGTSITRPGQPVVGRPADGPVPVVAKRRFFGSRTLSPDRYAADFAKVTQEVLQHLAAVPGVQLEVRLEVSAVAPDGFPDDKVRTVGENATTLKFEQSGFEES